jgi:hypothetical protein
VIPWRWLNLAGAILAGLGLWVVMGWRLDASKLDDARAALSVAQAAHNAEISALRLEIQRGYVASSSYQAELERLRARPVPVRTVRLCPDAPVPRAAEGGPAGGSDEAAAPGGVVPGSPGRDIGPDLYQLADRADELSARLRGCQHLLAR